MKGPATMAIRLLQDQTRVIFRMRNRPRNLKASGARSPNTSTNNSASVLSPKFIRGSLASNSFSSFSISSDEFRQARSRTFRRDARPPTLRRGIPLRRLGDTDSRPVQAFRFPEPKPETRERNARYSRTLSEFRVAETVALQVQRVSYEIRVSCTKPKRWRNGHGPRRLARRHNP